MTHYLKKASTPAGVDSDTSRSVRDTVSAVIADVRTRGDAAVREYSQKFDKWSPESFQLSDRQIADIVASVPEQALLDIKTVQERVRTFAVHQRNSLSDFEVETEPGVFLGQRNIPVSSAGAYVPGGRYPLVASAHMTVVTAKVAGVQRVTACTPPIRARFRRLPWPRCTWPAPTRSSCWAAPRPSQRWPWAPRRSVKSTCWLALVMPMWQRRNDSCSERWALICSPVRPRSW